MLLTALFVMTSCNEKMAPVTDEALQFSYLDESKDPKQDFYAYANGGWQKNHPLPAEYGRYGSFDQLGENVQKQLMSLIDSLAANHYPMGSVEQKIGDLYRLKMDSARLNAEGIQPLLADLKKIDDLSSKQAFVDLMGEMGQYNTWPFFVLYVGADEMNSEMNMIQTYQAGLGMGERDYYLNNDDRSKHLRSKYNELMVKVFEWAGYSKKQATQAAKDVMSIEMRLAKSSYSNVELRDPYKNYHKQTYAQLKELTPSFDWDRYTAKLGIRFDEINVAQEEFVKESANIIEESSLSALRHFLAWTLLNASSNCLSDDLADLSFEFYGKALSGTEVMRPRWKRAVGMLNGSLGEAIGIAYVGKYFPPEAKERMMELVGNLQKSLGERIQQLTWMSDETKAKAMDKLSTFRVKIGYPDKWKDYTSMAIDPAQSLYENLKTVSHFYYLDRMNRIGQPVDRDEWLMSPQTVNAYYNPTTNEICFPAGILQPPFFFMNGDDAVNYGAIGVVIGHEMTHGFDDQGCQYDKNGNLSNWWTEEDAQRFAERTTVLKNYFDSIEVAPGVHANGAFTLGENIADHGGLQVSFNAFQKTLQGRKQIAVDGVPANQRFFIAYAHVWADNIRPEEVLRRTAEDPHSLGRWRVNGTLPHIAAFAEAFDLKEGDAMYLPAEERVSIW